MHTANTVPDFIKDTPVAISIYSITQEACHYHEGFLEIIYCFKGNAVIHIAYEDIPLTDGDIISCDPHDIHALQSSENNLFVSFYFDLRHPIFNNPDLPYMFFVCERYVLRKEKQDEMQNLKHLLLTMLYFYCFPHEKVSQRETFCNLALKIMDIMLEHFHFFNYVANTLDYSQEAKQRYEKVMVLTNQRYSEKLTITKIGAQLHLNSNYLSHFFKKTSFVGYSSYLNFVRIYHSEVLLLDSIRNISDISYTVGYSDPKFYYRSFKKWYGCTPLQHRTFFKKIEERSQENQFYDPKEISAQLEHYISYYFATLHIPEFWNVPFVLFRNVPLV